MACKVIFKGNESTLYKKLLEIFNNNEELANVNYNYFKTQEFINEFGDYETDYSSDLKTIEPNRLEDNGEPKLFKDNKGTYYLDKYNEKIYYPYNKNTLNSIFSYVESQELTKLLALDFVQRAGFNLNFNELDLNSTNNITLKQSVIAKLNEKIIEFSKRSASQWKTKAINLEIVRDNHIDELVNNITNYFRELKLVYNENLENTETEDLTEEENSERGQQFGVASFERSTKDNISANIKLRLSLIPDISKTDYIFNDITYTPFDEIYSDLLKVLTNKIALVKNNNQEDIFNIYLNEIDKLSKRKNQFKELYRILTHPSITDNIKSEFVQSFNLDRINYINSEVSDKIDTEVEFTYDEQGNVTGTKKSKEIKVFEHTVRNVSNIGSKAGVIVNQWGINFKKLFIDNKENILTPEKRQNLQSISNNLKEIQNSKTPFNDRVNILVENLRKLGIETTEKGFSYYLDDLQLESDNDTNIRILNETINNTILFLNRLVSGKVQTSFKNSYLNPLLDQAIFKNISEAESFYLNEGSDASIFTSGKNKWIYSYPSYLSSTIKLWKSDRNILLNYYNSSPYNQGSAKLRWLLALDEDVFEKDRINISLDRINNIELNVFNNFQEEGNSTDGVDNKSISKNDYFVDNFNKLLAFKKGAKVYERTVTPADKGTQYELYTGFNIDTNARYENGRIIINNESLDIVYNYFKSEYNRMHQAYLEMQVKPENELISFYHLGQKNALKSQLFPLLSYDKISKELDKKVTKEMRFDAIYDENGFAHLENLDIIKDKIIDYIRSEISDQIISTHNQIKNLEIFTLNEDGKYEINGIDTQILDNYSGNKTIKIASDIFVNGLINQVEYSKMFSGDVAYYKNTVDYKKRIPATYTDGLQLRLNNENKTFNIAVIDGVEVATPFLEELSYLPEEILKYYKNINSTDAQAWITPQRWKTLLEGLGKFDKVSQGIYNKMMSGKDEVYTEKELKKMAQPLKGVYFDINNGVPTYLKYSQAVLIPNLIKGSGLERIYKKMINSKVDELITIDGVKVGSPKTTNIHNENGTLKDSFSLNPITIKSSGWKLQQDLPVKGFKQTQVGSQIQKNIYQGLSNNLDKTFYFNDIETTGLEIMRMIDKTIGQLSDFGKDSIKREFDLNEDFEIKNLSRFYGAMIDELKSRGGSQNLINALESETSLYGIPQAHSKLMNIFASIINDRMIKIRTNGGSFIQMSNFGLNKDEANSKGVIWSPNSLSTTHEPYVYTGEDGRTKVRPGGILISGSFIAKYIPDYRKYTPEELFISYNGGDPIIDKKILENIIGYRIPNQGLSSNDALEIVGILPEEVGDTIVAYTGITTKTGSDYDIDKMYMMIANYYLENDRLKYVNSNGNSKESVQNRLIELYKSVLTNVENINEIMTPIDFPFIKDDINDLFPKDSSGNLDVFNPIEDVNIKYEFSAGKAGVGQEANALVDHVRGTMANLRFNSEIVWGHEINGQNKLDEIYSIELTNEDIKYYLKDYNSNKSDKNKLTLNDVESLKKIKISNSLSAVLNAFVDIAKDPYITRGNWVTQTTNTGNLMLRMGIHPLYVNAFIGQPIIKDYVNFLSNKESIVNNNSGDMQTKFKFKLINDSISNNSVTVNGITKNYDVVYNSLVRYAPDMEVYKESKIDTSLSKFTADNILKLFKADDVKLTQSERNALNSLYTTVKEAHTKTFFPKFTNITKKSLESLRSQIKGESDNEYQLSVLDTFYKLQEMSKYVRINNDASKLDVNGMGKNITTLFITNNTINYLNYLERKDPKALIGFNTKLINPYTGESTLLNNYKKNVIDYPIELTRANPKLFFTANEAIQNTFNFISLDVQGNILLDENLGTKLESEFYSYLMSGFKPLQTTFDEKSDLLKQFPKEFEKFKKEHLDEYKIVDELDIRLGDNNVSFVGLNNRKKSNEFEFMLVNSWRDLLDDYPDFGNKLIKYSYLTSGFKNNMTQFYSYIPQEWFNENKVNSYIISKSREYENLEIDDNFLNQVYLHNLTDRQLVPNIFENKTKMNPNGTLTLNTNKKRARYYVTLMNDEGDNLYFKLLGYDNNYNAIYQRIGGIGYRDNRGNKVYEYNIDGSVNTIIKAKQIQGNIVETPISRDYMTDLDQIDFNNEMNSKIDNTIEPITYQDFISQLEELNVAEVDIMTVDDFNLMSQEEIRTALEQAKKC